MISSRALVTLQSTFSSFLRTQEIVTGISAHASRARRPSIEPWTSEDSPKTSRLLLREWGEVLFDHSLRAELGQKAMGVVTMLQYCSLW